MGAKRWTGNETPLCGMTWNTDPKFSPGNRISSVDFWHLFVACLFLDSEPSCHTVSCAVTASEWKNVRSVKRFCAFTHFLPSSTHSRTLSRDISWLPAPSHRTHPFLINRLMELIFSPFFRSSRSVIRPLSLCRTFRPLYAYYYHCCCWWLFYCLPLVCQLQLKSPSPCGNTYRTRISLWLPTRQWTTPSWT